MIIGALLLPLGCGSDQMLQSSDLCSDYPESAIATFEDANLEAEIRAAYSWPALLNFTCGWVAGRTRLIVFSGGIESLVGIQNLTGLRWLSLYDGSITDLSPLAGLANLQELGLRGNSISDLSPLSGLTTLTELWLGLNSISDVSALSELTGLTALSLNGNSISDISALGGLTSLTDLQMLNNSITDISALSGLPRLTLLALDGNPALSDIQPLLDNPGLGPGDRVSLRSTDVSCEDVAALQANRVAVTSDCT